MMCLRCDGLMVQEKSDQSGRRDVGDSQFVEDPMFRCASSFFYRTRADEVYPFNPIQEETQC